MVERPHCLHDDNGHIEYTGRIRRETDLQGRVHGFTYNLLGESHPDFGTLAYTYDAAGNRKSKSNGSVTEYYGHDYQNKLLWANQGGNLAPTSAQSAPYRRYTYDGAGFPTLVERGAGGSVANDLLTWDGAGNLRRLQTTGALTGDYLAEYDGSGDRVTATINGLQHIYSGDLFDEAGNTLFTPGISENSGGQDRFYQADHLGSTRYLTNGQGVNQSIFRYDAFGSRSAQSGTADTKYGFAGAWGYQGDGPAGLQLLGARYYDPLMGRFISPDPIGFAGGLNLYEYCFSDPVNEVDPEGLEPPGAVYDDDGNPIIATGLRGRMAQGKATLLARPEWQLGSNERQSYSFWLGLITGPVGMVKSAIDGITGHDGIAGTHLSPGERAINLLPGAIHAAGMVPINIKCNNTNLGTRLGGIKTMLQNRQIAKELRKRGWTVTNGGSQIPPRKEFYFPGPNGGVRGSAYADITATKNGKTLHIQTASTYSNGQFKPRELRAARHIRANLKPRDHLLLIPKR